MQVMNTYTEAQDAINAAESLAVLQEQTIAIVARPEGYGVMSRAVLTMLCK